MLASDKVIVGKLHKTFLNGRRLAITAVANQILHPRVDKSSVCRSKRRQPLIKVGIADHRVVNPMP